MPLRRGEPRPLSVVAELLGFSSEFADREVVESPSALVRDAAAWLENSRPQRQNHWPALALALTAQIESLSVSESTDSFDDVLESHPPETAEDSTRAVNTLNLTRTDSNAEPVRLRAFYNRALNVIRHTMLRDHPSNAPHATQSWTDYRPLIKMIGRMSALERRSFVEIVWQRGVLDQPVRPISTTSSRAVRPFELVLRQMPTSVPGVRGGAVLQGIAFGYLRADSPNLILESHNVNTGSSRAGMLGDVDGFRGSEPELAAEVKDVHLTPTNYLSELGDFFEDILNAPNVTAVVICRDVTDETRTLITTYFEEIALDSRASDRRREFSPDRITVLTISELADRVRVWDVPKQEEALRGLEYYLGRVQKTNRGVEFVREWLQSRGVTRVAAADAGGEI